jgi:hypothetical protein
VKAFVSALPEGENRAELAFLLLQTRRHVAPWSQQLAGPGHVVVYPYLEHNYARFLLSLKPLAKLGASLQAKCLQRFAPEFYGTGGSRQIPIDARPVAPRTNAANAAACIRLLETELRGGIDPRLMTTFLTPAGRALRLGARVSASIAHSKECRWLAPLLSLVVRQTTHQPCLVVERWKG